MKKKKYTFTKEQTVWYIRWDGESTDNIEGLSHLESPVDHPRFSCNLCGELMEKHGILDRDDNAICPGDFIVSDNEHLILYTCKRMTRDEFVAKYGELHE